MLAASAKLHRKFISAGVKNMLAGEQQAAVTVAVEGLMDAKPIPELEAFATFDPKVSPNSAIKTWCTCKMFPADMCRICSCTVLLTAVRLQVMESFI